MVEDKDPGEDSLVVVLGAEEKPEGLSIEERLAALEAKANFFEFTLKEVTRLLLVIFKELGYGLAAEPSKGRDN